MFRVGASGLSLRAWCHCSVPLVGRRAHCLWDDQSVAVHAHQCQKRLSRWRPRGSPGSREWCIVAQSGYGKMACSKRVIIGRPFALPAELGMMPPLASLGSVPTMEGVIPRHALSFSTASLHSNPSVSTAAAAAAFCNPVPDFQRQLPRWQLHRKGGEYLNIARSTSTSHAATVTAG